MFNYHYITVLHDMKKVSNYVDTAGTRGTGLVIDKLKTFYNNNTVVHEEETTKSINVIPPQEGSVARAVFPMAGVSSPAGGVEYMMELFVKSPNNHSLELHYYSDINQKRYALSYFTTQTLDTEIVKEMAAAFNRQLFEQSNTEKVFIQFHADGTNLVVYTTNEYLKFYKGEIYSITTDPSTFFDTNNVVSRLAIHPTSVTTLPPGEFSAPGCIYSRTGIGTYSYIINNQQIPTEASRRFGAELIDNKALPNHLYFEVVFYGTVHRTVTGMSAVAQDVTSTFNYCVYVDSTVMGIDMLPDASGNLTVPPDTWTFTPPTGDPVTFQDFLALGFNLTKLTYQAPQYPSTPVEIPSPPYGL